MSRISTAIDTLDRSVQQLHSAFSEQTGLTVAGIETLDQLYQRDGQMASELARSIGRAATSYTPILDGLERAGLICRQADKADRRAVRIFLTDKGRNLENKVQGHLDSVDKHILAMLQRRMDMPVPSEIITELFAPIPVNVAVEAE